MVGMLRLVTANVNGIRATARRGGMVWLEAAQADVICLQEVRASADQLREVLAAGGFADWHVALSEAAAKGRAGVAVLSRQRPLEIREGVGHAEFEATGRWVEVDLPTPSGRLTVVSAYVHTGDAGTPRQAEKERFLDAMTARMGDLRALADAGGHAVVTGDLNVAHHEVDICNWKGNRGRAGFLPSERAYFDRWFDGAHWVDVHRATAGEGPGPYTWWTWRGQAFDRDVGWRIDYQLATAALAARAVKAEVGRAPTYAQRWSDHAPLVVDYDV
jgi:exodeoxyribonuclease III